MATIGEVLQQAIELFGRGELDNARRVCDQILMQLPDQPETLHFAGLIEHTRGRTEKAQQLIAKSIESGITDPSAFMNHGIVLAKLGEFAAAIDNYQIALQGMPDSHEVLNNLGTAYMRNDQNSEAVTTFKKAIELSPKFMLAHCNLGDAYRAIDNLDDAKSAYLAAYDLQPNDAITCQRLADICERTGDTEAAVDWMKKSVAIEPDNAEAHQYLANLQAATGHEEAAEDARKASKHLARKSEKAAAKKKAELVESDAIAYFERGNGLCALRKLDQAEVEYREAVKLMPAYAPAWVNLGNLLLESGRISEAYDCNVQILRHHPDDIAAHSNLLGVLNYDPTASPQRVFDEHANWGQVHTEHVVKIAKHFNDKTVDRRLRVGYVSPEFRKHAVAFFFEPVITNHSDQVETFIYSNTIKEDETSKRIRAAADHWRIIRDTPSDHAAQMILNDQIDILVDLAGHTRADQLMIFAYKAAPIQIEYLGYPNTSGLSEMDYRLTDDIADPVEEPTPHTETLVRLPHGLACFRPDPDAPDVVDPPVLINGHVTFGALNTLAKVNGRVLDLWCRVLKLVPDSHFLLFRDSLRGSLRDRFENEFIKRGISADRLHLEYELPEGQTHHNVFNRIDILLDSFPWNGHTIACEAMWMGVPVITLAGRTLGSRLAASSLTHAGMDSLVAQTPPEFVRIAKTLAADRDLLTQTRRMLRPTMRDSDLCNGPQFAKALEDVYREMWKKWCMA